LARQRTFQTCKLQSVLLHQKAAESVIRQSPMNAASVPT